MIITILNCEIWPISLGTQKQFEVGWDGANNAISITSGKPYTTAGGDMAGKGSGNMAASPTNSKIYLDSKEIKLTAYNIGGNNYFKLRDIGQALNFSVEWNQAAQTVIINTSKGIRLKRALSLRRGYRLEL